MNAHTYDELAKRNYSVLSFLSLIFSTSSYVFTVECTVAHFSTRIGTQKTD
jgi:hypothetical protein